MKDIIKKRILIFGSNGMLGQRLVEFYDKNPRVELFTASNEEESYFSNIDYEKVDFTEKDDVKKIISKFLPDTIINVAAFTNVDLSETEKELAWKINVEAVKNIAVSASSIDAHFIHISSDYIFDGNEGPYSEEDLPNPIGYYGRTKLASENAIKSTDAKATIIRTNVLYGPAKFGRPDFVKWVVNSLRDGKEINIVTDQFGNPTFLDDLVQGIRLIEKQKSLGVYNISGKDFLTRYDFTIKIAEYFNLPKEKINKILTADLNQKANRPLKSGLKIDKAIRELGFKPHSINESLEIMKIELGL